MKNPDKKVNIWTVDAKKLYLGRKGGGGGGGGRWGLITYT